MNITIPGYIKEITPYPPGKPIEELEREYGIRNSIKLASNENPLGPSPLAVQAMIEALNGLHRYPDGSGYYLTRALADRLDVDPGQVILGNGSNELIEFLVKAFVQRGDEVISSFPSFLMYQKFVQIRGGANVVVPLRDNRHDLAAVTERVSPATRLIFLDNPNNPTGSALSPDELERFLARLPDHVIVVLDEAYRDFMDPDLRPDINSLLENRDGRCAVVSLRTFSKAYGLAGLRIGFALAEENIAGCLHKVRQPFNINLVALRGARAALEDQDHYERTLALTAAGKKFLLEEVEKLGCIGHASQTNFFLIDVRGEANALYEVMLRKGVIVRSMQSYGFPGCIRINVGTMEENKRFLRALEESLGACGYV